MYNVKSKILHAAMVSYVFVTSTACISLFTCTYLEERFQRIHCQICHSLLVTVDKQHRVQEFIQRIAPQSSVEISPHKLLNETVSC